MNATTFSSAILRIAYQTLVECLWYELLELLGRYKVGIWVISVVFI